MKHKVVDGRYRVIREIARGGVCTVFEATHTVMGRQVALKMLSKERRADPVAKERLLREARMLGAVAHPNLVLGLDAGVTREGEPYLVMELLQGRTLSGLLAARQQLGVRRTIQLGRALAAPLTATHQRGYVHRDLKPANVVIALSDSGEEVVKLLDFGIAREEHKERSLTIEGELIGTPEYMAPEQLMAEEVDHRCDIYALGVTLYECLSGKVPFTGKFGEVLLKVSTSTPPPLSEAVPDVPAELARIIDKALARDRRDRYQSAGELAEALAKVERTLLGSNETSLRGAAQAAHDATALDGAQRRRFRRAPYVTPVRVIRPTGQTEDGRSEDLSEGGLLVLLESPSNREETVRVRFALPTTGRIIEVPAIAKWVRKVRDHGAVGLEFSELPESARNGIRQYVALMQGQ